MIVGMNHFTVIAEDRQKTLDFYVGLLGLKEGWRPDLGFDGAWLYGDGTQAILHLYFDRKPPQVSCAFPVQPLRALSCKKPIPCRKNLAVADADIFDTAN